MVCPSSDVVCIARTEPHSAQIVILPVRKAGTTSLLAAVAKGLLGYCEWSTRVSLPLPSCLLLCGRFRMHWTLRIDREMPTGDGVAQTHVDLKWDGRWR